MPDEVLYEEDGSLGYITLNRPEKLNTLTGALLEAFSQAVDRANDSDAVRCIILRGAGRSFSGGYDLNPGGQRIAPPANRPNRRWDPVRDYQNMGRNVKRFMKLWEVPKPVIAQVHGWCVGGGTDLALCSDLIFMADDAYIGYPPARVYGTPTSMMWVYRLGLEAAKRYMLTGDAIDAPTALRIGLVSEIAPAAELPGIVERFARRFENIPWNQLALNKLLINQAYENMGLRTTQMFGTFFDGMTRNTQEAIDWRDSFSTLGFRETIRRRDAPFEDYGERRRE
jgi:enoyl-CoA hydratase